MIASRSTRYQRLCDGGIFDVLIVGGGISGAPIYQKLRLAGYRVGLVDQGDFASGTSQASGMLIWGGLLYLKTFDFPAVLELCKARRNMMRNFPDEVTALDFEYRMENSGKHLAPFVWLALQFYWLAGACTLNRPLLAKGPWAVRFQEAMLRESDSRFVIDRIRGLDSEHGIALNHCKLESAEYDAGKRIWNVGLRDGIDGTEYEVQTKTMVNAAGVWADNVNRTLGIKSPMKHVFSKGVYLAFPNDQPGLTATVQHTRDGKDVITSVPWGPVTLWGPTETGVDDLAEGFSPAKEDVRFLLTEARKCFNGRARGVEDVVSLRCGVRPLAVPANFNRDACPLTLSRRHRLVANDSKQTITIYGGKLTGSLEMTFHVVRRIRQWLEPGLSSESPRLTNPERGGPHGFVTPGWARDHEFCVTLEDYLRRRTSIAQWTPRMGLGNDNSRRESLLKVARELASGETTVAEKMVSAYERRVRETHDAILSV